ncbi:hypothetical protein [Micromonospora siamensis]|uniref:Uncharacterized protein n=1 Tax=Micromonospora siamensis TaxID=299152 RepID=A0A1C5JX06_9ACTN|nr:hypothetical protein [Micromonospora siamensis]SCG75110.1 hypothetical protein GA0074704_5125 [Micromonospora siamensis]
MSYDLAVWEGDPPSDDEAAGETYDALYHRYFENEAQPPTPRILAYVDAVSTRWPDLYGHEAQLFPLSNGLIDEASGPMVYFTMPFNRADEVSAAAAQLAADHGLVCYDPRWAHARPAAGHEH